MKRRACILACLACLAACTSTAPTTDPPRDADVVDTTTGDAAPPDLGVADAGTLDAARPDSGDDRCSGPRISEVAAIGMRDGNTLHGLIDRPDCPSPAVLIQTPYNAEGFKRAFLDDRTGAPLFSSSHYAFVVTDWRGRFGSRAAAVMGAQPHGTDGYDLVEWIAAQPWSDGKVGMWGVSALCVQQYRTAAEQPPHLVAAVPIFCNKTTAYTNVYPGGVLRREYVDSLDRLGFGLRALYEAHPTEDALWRAAARALPASQIAVPMLVIAGWWDLDPAGTFATWRDLVSTGDPAARGAHRLLVGGWIHFATNPLTGGGQRALDAEELTYADRMRRIETASLAFFDHHLRSVGDGQVEPVRFEHVNRGWRTAPAWPPATVAARVFYLRTGGVLSEAAAGAGTLELRYDPTDPSPTVGGGTLDPGLHHGPTSQAPVLARTDHLTFATAPLRDVLPLLGSIEVALAVSTTGADTDFAVRLTDVAADGTHTLIGEGIRRLKLRDSYAAASPVVPGDRYDLVVPIGAPLAYDVPPGHRLGLIITSSNSPRYARNPNDGADFFADSAAPLVVTNTIHLDGSQLRLTTED